MNWTGGRLQRHSRNSGGKSLTNIQKQHFAKVRTRLQNGPRAVSPLDFSLFHAAQDRHEDTRLKEEDARLERQPKRQRTLREYDSTAALANRLSSMKPRLTSHRRGLSSQLRPSREPAERRYPHSHHGEAAKRAPITMPAITIREGVDDLYDDNDEEEPEQYPQSSRRSTSFTLPPRNPTVLEHKTLEDQRQSLLEQEDWVGTAIIRPLKISFPTSKNRDKIGRRRKINEEDRIRRAAPPRQVYEPLLREQLDAHSRGWDDPGLGEDISVRIGGQFHGSQRITLRGVEDAIFGSQHDSGSSDSMLLDREDAYYGEQGGWDLSRRNNLAGNQSQQRVSEDSLWPSRMSLAAQSIRSDSTGADSDLILMADKLPPKLYDLRDDQDGRALKDLGNIFQSGDLQHAQKCSQSSSKRVTQLHQRPAHHKERATETTHVFTKGNANDSLPNHNAESFMSNEIAADSRTIYGAPPIEKIEPMRLVFGSTPPLASTAHTSENGGRGNHGTQAVRSTVAEASDDMEDPIAKGSDDMDWEKLVGLVETPKVDRDVNSSFQGADSSGEVTRLKRTNLQEPLDPSLDISGAPQKQQHYKILEVGDQLTAVAGDKSLSKPTARLQTDDEIWMKFLEIGGDDEENDEQDKISEEGHSLEGRRSLDDSRKPLSYRRPVTESILAHASSTSISSPLSNAQFASDKTDSPHKRSTTQSLVVSQASSVPSLIATAHTSSPDPLTAGTYVAPSTAAATIHSSSNISLEPPSTSTAPTARTQPQQPPQSSSPDPLTTTSPSMHLTHPHHPRTQQTTTNHQKILFTKPTPFTGRHASTTTSTPYGYKEPLHLGRNITGASSRPSVKKLKPRANAKVTAKVGKGKGGRGRGVSGEGAGGAGGTVYDLPDSEEGRSRGDEGVEGIEDDDDG